MSEFDRRVVMAIAGCEGKRGQVTSEQAANEGIARLVAMTDSRIVKVRP